MYAQITDDTITQIARRPRDLVNLDDGTKPLWSEYIDADTLAACGWFPVVDNPPTFDEATEVRERGDVVLVDGTPTVEYTVRPLTAEELAARQQAADDEAEREAAKNMFLALKTFNDTPNRDIVAADVVANAKRQNQVLMRLIRDQYGR